MEVNGRPHMIKVQIGAQSPIKLTAVYILNMKEKHSHTDTLTTIKFVTWVCM